MCGIMIGLGAVIIIPFVVWLMYHATWRLSDEHLARLVSQNHTPHVDLFITCYKEPMDIVQDTIEAALRQTYPSQCYMIYVLDDGGSDTLRDWVTDHDRAGSRLVYIRRAKGQGVPHHYKAGALTGDLVPGRNDNAYEWVEAAAVFVYAAIDFIPSIFAKIAKVQRDRADKAFMAELAAEREKENEVIGLAEGLRRMGNLDKISSLKDLHNSFDLFN